MKNAVGYIRVSTKEQVDNYSLRNQEQSISDYCSSSSELNLTGVYRDEGKSAKTLKGRDQLLKLLNDCRKKDNKIDCVVVYHPDRLARNYQDHAYLINELAQYKVEVKFVIVPSDGSTTGNFGVKISALFAEFENDLKSDRVKQGMRKALEEGRWTGKTPLGYIRNREAKVPSLLIDEQRVENIRFVFQQVDLGIKSKAEILREVTRKGLVNVKGQPLTNQAIDKMLVNPIYSGMVQSKKHDFMCQGNFEAIVSRELFERVNAKPGKLRGIKHTGRDAEFPLRRFVVCGKCGVSLTGSEPSGRSKKYKYYRCKNSKCKGESIPLIDLELQYLEVLDKLSAKPATLNLLDAVIRDVWKTKRKDAHLMQKANDRQLKVLSGRRQAVIEEFLYKKSISEEVYNEQLNMITSEVEVINAEQSSELMQEERLEEIFAKAKAHFTNLPYCWNRLQSPVRRRFQSLIHPEGMILLNGKLETAKKSWLFIDFVDLQTQSNTCVPPTGFEPVLPP